ncbi:MAG: penicillin-binding transpeptidase domain-containing protein, partial [Nitriliruptor sp.]
CSIALGSADIFPLGMVPGYGTWANDGVLCEPYVIERVLDRDGQVLYQHEPRCERIVDGSTASQMRAILRGPVSPSGTAPSVGNRVGGGVFGKTGTTNSSVDAWFVGSAGDLTHSAWVGFETPRPMEDIRIDGRYYNNVTGGSVQASIWADYVADAAS